MPDEIRRWLNAPECGDVEYVKSYVETKLTELHALTDQTGRPHAYSRRASAIRVVLHAVDASQYVDWSAWHTRGALLLASNVEIGGKSINISPFNFSSLPETRERELARERRLVDWAAAARRQ